MDITVIGAGPAGMMAAYAAARAGHSVTIFEKNEKLGKKLFITGKGRCNLTNACDVTELFDSICRGEKFLYSSIYGFDNSALCSLFESEGLALKTERGNRVFPASDHSSDVIKTLEKMLKASGVKIRLNTPVADIAVKGQKAVGVVLKNGETVSSDRVIVATGGLSYKTTGSTGDGMKWAKKLGHKVSDCIPSLVPFECEGEVCRQLQGLSLKNVTLSLFKDGKRVFCETGEMLFTHFGISGPLVLTASALCPDPPLEAKIDLKSGLDEQQLDKRLLRDFEKYANRDFINALDELLPQKLIPVVAQLSCIDPRIKVNSITKQQRRSLLELLKGFPLTVTGKRGFDEAIITRGGINLKEVDPGTMESKLVSGLYFVGEVLDADALTGGYNLQIAWSTGYAAGINME
ncbi:MAG: NAD(P)/FAD-dependent oxidoreductase [Lachnospiraceae bacterium]|nr:NAD(P)/FAD-dependent oxidoreductase [Lachnospiraceae bacterium]